MHLGMSIRYSLKNPDKDYRGILGEHVTYGARGLVSLHGLLACIIKEVVCYYIRFQDAATINASLDKLRAALETLKVVEERDEPQYQAPSAAQIARQMAADLGGQQVEHQISESEQDEPTAEVTCESCGRAFQMYCWAVKEGREKLCSPCLHGADDLPDIFDMHHDLLDLP